MDQVVRIEVEAHVEDVQPRVVLVHNPLNRRREVPNGAREATHLGDDHAIYLAVSGGVRSVAGQSR